MDFVVQKLVSWIICLVDGQKEETKKWLRISWAYLSKLFTQETGAMSPSVPTMQSFLLTRDRTILIFVFKDARDASITAKTKDQRVSARLRPIAGFTIVHW